MRYAGDDILFGVFMGDIDKGIWNGITYDVWIDVNGLRDKVEDEVEHYVYEEVSDGIFNVIDGE